MQHPRGITNPAGIHGHIHDLALDVRRLPGVGILQEKRPAAIGARATPVALLAFGRRAMSHHICTLAVGTGQHLCNHGGSLSHRWFWSAPTLRKYNRSTALEHLPFIKCFWNSGTKAAIRILFRPIGHIPICLSVEKYRLI